MISNMCKTSKGEIIFNKMMSEVNDNTMATFILPNELAEDVVCSYLNHKDDKFYTLSINYDTDCKYNYIELWYEKSEDVLFFCCNPMYSDYLNRYICFEEYNIYLYDKIPEEDKNEMLEQIFDCNIINFDFDKDNLIDIKDENNNYDRIDNFDDINTYVKDVLLNITDKDDRIKFIKNFIMNM